MERLSGLDASFLYFETPSTHLHVGGIMVFDPSTSSSGDGSFEWVCDQVNRRLVPHKEFRRRPVRVPFNLHHPVWIEDPHFDLRRHVKRIGAPSPGGMEELAELAGEILSIPLDRNKPLWEMWVVDGLENGYVALIAKMHHATIDGVTGANLMVHLFDLEPETEAPPVPELPEGEHVPSDFELVGYAVRSRLRRPLQFVRAVRDTGEAVVNVARRRRGGGGGMPTPFTAPRTSFNGAITPRRSVGFSSIPLDEVKKVKDLLGCTVNDIVLAVCGGALRRYLEERGEVVDKPLIAACPVSMHGVGDDGEGVNQVSAMFASLATDIDDPVERVREINKVSRAAKEEHQAIGASFLRNWAEFSGPNLGYAFRLYSRMKLAERHAPIHNLVISNVPGPPFPLYFGGAKLVALSPLGPIFEGAGLNVTVLSYLDSVGFGLHACPDVIPDVWEMAGLIPQAFEELQKAAAADSGAVPADDGENSEAAVEGVAEVTE
ncbi:MAG TPA: wax ester/triacylglycerol synthase family O-acyltransferase [Acidimicrobiia bacterium]|nr:wax ester/triacylglycerol synthase family O-acyltransferase [Acidimicrobiia bacterium]